MSSDHGPGTESPTFFEHDRRTQFMACALDTVADLGFARTSLDEVAKRADVSEDEVLCHYRSNEELLKVAVEVIYDKATTELVAATESADDHRGKLDAYLHASVMFAWINQQRLAGVYEISRNLRDAAGRLHYRYDDRVAPTSTVERMITDGQQDGEFTDVDAHTVAVMIRSTIDALHGMFAAEPGLEALAFSARLRNVVGRIVLGEPTL